MDIKINILNVLDGDAIIIELTKPDKNLVMLIDGGQPRFYKEKVKPKLDEILPKYGKLAPDIVVCTHYDSDHIGGLIPMIEAQISQVKEVWVHKTPELLEKYIEEIERDLEGISKSANASLIGALQEAQEMSLGASLQMEAYIENLYRSLPQLKKLVELIPPSKLREVFHGQSPLKDWPEVKVLGPTKAYFDTLFPEGKSLKRYLVEEAAEAVNSKITFERDPSTPCEALKTDAQTSLTATNKASIIIAIDIKKKRYLFTGDAGIESFKKIPNWEKELKNLYFLKVPHHASDNNISKELISVMQPMYAYNTGDRHQDDAVLFCMKSRRRNKVVKSTKTDGDLCFPAE